MFYNEAILDLAMDFAPKSYVTIAIDAFDFLGKGKTGVNLHALEIARNM